MGKGDIEIDTTSVRQGKPYKQTKQMNISDEERQKRKERMIKLRERLGMVGNGKGKQPKKTKPIKTIKEESSSDEDEEKQIEETKKNIERLKNNRKVKPTEVVSSSEEESSEDELPPPKPKKTKKTTPPVSTHRENISKPKPKKSIKIKYYDTSVSKDEMETDAKILESIHKQDHEAEERKILAKQQPTQSTETDSDELEYY